MKKIEGGKKPSLINNAAGLKQPLEKNPLDEFFKHQNEAIDIFVEKLGTRGDQSANIKPRVVDKTKLGLKALIKMGTLNGRKQIVLCL